ncbi:MAG: cysteine desulfurase [Pseudarcicella sp.]|nr:cysteine desulfurase [Pseudarcicella sp.]
MDIHKIRAQFPILNQKIHGKDLVYFDNAATTQKPQIVIDAIAEYYLKDNANIHRGIHSLAERATKNFEETRETVRKFLGASSIEEIIFTSGTTQGINLVASSFGNAFIQKGDQIIISGLEHHSNIVPWQMLCESKGIELKIIPVNDLGELEIDKFEQLLNPRVKLVALNHVSNSLGTINPIKTIIDLSHNIGAKVLIDGAQASSHIDIDVQALDVDFYVFSAHKLYGPTGIGVLYGKKELLEKMPPYMGGGEMIKEVSFEKTTFNDLPYKFEAGTPNIADVVALKAAIDFINEIGKNNIQNHENELLKYATAQLSDIKGLKIIGEAKEKIAVISFIIEGIHHQDIGILLDTQGIAVRTGHHCTQPLMQRFGIAGTSRASFAVYNTFEEVDKLKAGLEKVIKMMQ